ncbi:hypothetical protein L2E82_11014 [Cichorium intybus]|uniref:Uncharacterized protein n=1 Tax=Cichorium intybus TaxID=13427 RepID=A0ACB9GD53_CICIN|nr:hypothetical protein L2E82_11014 [Cichorium intybus]
MNTVVEISSARKDWWAEDLCEIEIDVYQNIMLAVISKGRGEDNMIREALKTYCRRWLLDCNDSLKLDEAIFHDLLIPTEYPQTRVYDIELMQFLVDQFFNPKNIDNQFNIQKVCSPS